MMMLLLVIMIVIVIVSTIMVRVIVSTPRDLSVGGRVDDLFRGLSDGMENMNVKKSSIGNGNCSSLIRQSSSPAGFLSNLADDIGAAMVLVLSTILRATA